MRPGAGCQAPSQLAGAQMTQLGGISPWGVEAPRPLCGTQPGQREGGGWGGPSFATWPLQGLGRPLPTPGLALS